MLQVLPYIEPSLPTVPTYEELFRAEADFWPLDCTEDQISDHLITRRAIEVITDLRGWYAEDTRITNNIRALPGRFVLWHNEVDPKDGEKKSKAIHIGRSQKELVILCARDTAYDRKYAWLTAITERLLQFTPHALLAYCDDALMHPQCPSYIAELLRALRDGNQPAQVVPPATPDSSSPMPSIVASQEGGSEAAS